TAIPREELSGHCYFEAVKWLAGRRLQIRISGHRDQYPANGFEYEFIFDLGSGGFKKVTKKKPNQRVERTGASRLAHLEFVGQWRLAPAARAGRWATLHLIQIWPVAVSRQWSTSNQKKG